MKIETVRKIVADDPMELERILSCVYTHYCVDRNNYAIFDGGAHKGYHTFRMLELPGCLKVHAVEADPYMFDLLSKKVASIESSTKERLVLHKVALQDDTDCLTIPWASSISHVGRSSIISHRGSRRTIWEGNSEISYRDAFEVCASTIDTLLKSEKLPVPFIKLDLEGADLLALRGASETLRSKRPVIAFENSFHAPKTHNFSLSDMISYLNKLGYVGLSYVGEEMSTENWFDFHEAWAIPEECIGGFQEILSDVLSSYAS